MKKSKLKFQFHNPNTAESTANYIVRIFMEADQIKVEHVIQNAKIEEQGRATAK